MSHRFWRLALLGVAITSTGCAYTLRVVEGDAIRYQCAEGAQVVVRYYSLSDDSLQFVKLTLPDGNIHTLPNAVSASGVRYTDEREVVWWNKGQSGFVQMRDDSGAWQVRYADCRP